MSDLSGQFNPSRPTAKSLLNKKRPKRKHLMNSNQMRAMLADSPLAPSSNDMLRKLGNNDISVAFGVPEGLKEDEYNKMELVFYSFKKRLAQKYIASFFNRLEEFELQNPHLDFPMTKSDELMTGRVTYDEDGNIQRIKMLQWTDKEKLQDFFVSVLERLGTLPNPPDKLVKDGLFHVVYSFNVKQ